MHSHYSETAEDLREEENILNYQNTDYLKSTVRLKLLVSYERYQKAREQYLQNV